MQKFVTLSIQALCFMMFLSCQRFKPETVNIPDYPDFEELYNSQTPKLVGKKLLKEVILDGNVESKTLDMDTSQWKKELAFLLEANPNQPGYVGAFDVTESERELEMVMKNGESGILKNLSLTKPLDGIWSLFAVIHEDKDVYAHHREVSVSFKDDLLDAFEIKGYQKMIMKDTVWFEIKGKVQ